MRIFTFMWPCSVTDFLIIKTNRCTNISNLFWNETLHVSDSLSVPHQELFTVHSAKVYVIQVMLTAFEQQQQDQDGTPFRSGWNRMELRSILIVLLLESCLKTCMTHTIAECTVNNSWWWTEELPETRRVSFQNKFEKSVYLFGFIIRKLDDS
jgi:hypothetical protein